MQQPQPLWNIYEKVLTLVDGADRTVSTTPFIEHPIQQYFMQPTDSYGTLKPSQKIRNGKSSAILIAGIVAVLALLWFGGLGTRHLADPDEGRYAEIPLQMLLTGDWITPRLNGLKYFEKPPLQYWATAASYALFGTGEAASRLWTALTGFFAVMATWHGGKRLFGSTAGNYAALILMSAFLFPLAGMVNTLDMGVSCFMTIALMHFLLAQRDDANALETRNGMWIAWAASGLAILSKGLIGVVLLGAVLVAYSILQRDRQLWRRLHLISGVAIMLVIAVPWFVLVSRANPEFPQFFFIHEHVDRFLTSVHGRSHPWYYYVPILAIGLLPWLGLLPVALKHAWQANLATRRFQPERFLLVWIVVIYLFFSVSNSKLPFYLVPILPAIALLMGISLSRMQGAQLFKYLLPAVVLGVTGAATAQYLEFLAPGEKYESFHGWLLLGMLTLTLSWGCGAWAAYRDRMTIGVLIAAMGTLLGLQIVMVDVDALAPELSTYRVAEKVRPLLTPEMPFYSVGTYRHGLAFYLQRSLTLVDYKGELAFGLEQEPKKGIADLETFSAVWRTLPAGLAVMRSTTFKTLLQQKLPMEVVHADTDLILVKKSVGQVDGAAR